MKNISSQNMVNYFTVYIILYAARKLKIKTFICCAIIINELQYLNEHYVHKHLQTRFELTDSKARCAIRDPFLAFRYSI